MREKRFMIASNSDKEGFSLGTLKFQGISNRLAIVSPTNLEMIQIFKIILYKNKPGGKDFQCA